MSGEEGIDLVCEDETAGVIDFYEVKREAARYQVEKLDGKIERFFDRCRITLKEQRL